MSKEYNGVTFFAPGEKETDHPAFQKLSKVSLGDVRFPFGFFWSKTVARRWSFPQHSKTIARRCVRRFQIGAITSNLVLTPLPKGA